jgi:hypothetical protein
MKMANVVSLRDIVDDTHPELNQAGQRGHIEELLRRYPDIREAETQEIVHFLATGRHLDVGLVAGNDAFVGKVAEIKRTHASRFRIKLHEAALFVLATVGPVAFLAVRYLFL